MRDFKFRVWDTFEEEMSYNAVVSNNLIVFNHEVEYVEGYVDTSYFVAADESNRKYFKIMQYTGIRDMSGKEIYEGDILEDLHGERSEVEYNGGAFIIKNRYDYWFMNYLATLDGDLYVEDYRIIGNIYENKDLLED